MEYLYHILIFILIYSILVQSLNLIMGFVGIVSMCHAIFSAIGAYTAALISINTGQSFIFSSCLGFMIAAAVGAMIALPSLRVRDEYLIVFTIGFQMVAYEFILTARKITEGQGGIPGIPSASLFGFDFDTPPKFLALITVVAIVCFFVCYRIINSPFGRVLKAIREEESASRALGKNSLLFKVLVFAIGGGLAAIGGSMMAYYVSFVSPFTFIVDVSISIIVMVVLGGVANFWGPLIGAGILIGLPEALRFVPGAADIIDVIREILYGLILMLLMIFRPQGILTEKARNYRRFFELSEKQEGRISESRSIRDHSSTSEVSIEVKNVSKSFGGLKAVDSASLTLPTGDIVGLIGPNGCGKTTLFNLITGYLTPDEGSISINSKPMTNVATYRIVENGVARSWQDVRIFNGMSVIENVMVACPNQKGENLLYLFFNPRVVNKEEQMNFIRSMRYLDMVGLSKKADELAVNLSSSEQKLVAIARLLATECPVLLLDEPTAALDFDSVKKIVALIKEIAQKTQKSILLVEHNLDVVRGLVDKAYFMSEGKVIDYGKPADLMANPKLVEVYFGLD